MGLHSAAQGGPGASCFHLTSWSKTRSSASLSKMILSDRVSMISNDQTHTHWNPGGRQEGHLPPAPLLGLETESWWSLFLGTFPFLPSIRWIPLSPGTKTPSAPRLRRRSLVICPNNKPGPREPQSP